MSAHATGLRYYVQTQTPMKCIGESFASKSEALASADLAYLSIATRIAFPVTVSVFDTESRNDPILVLDRNAMGRDGSR